MSAESTHRFLKRLVLLSLLHGAPRRLNGLLTRKNSSARSGRSMPVVRLLT
jgi:hypothetical protein